MPTELLWSSQLRSGRKDGRKEGRKGRKEGKEGSKDEEEVTLEKKGKHQVITRAKKT